MPNFNHRKEVLEKRNTSGLRRIFTYLRDVCQQGTSTMQALDSTDRYRYYEVFWGLPYTI